MHHKNRFHNVLTVFFLLAICACPLVQAGDNAFLRGDSNTDARVDLSDAIFTLAYLFQGGDAPLCLDALDSNDSGEVGNSAPSHLLRHI